MNPKCLATSKSELERCMKSAADYRLALEDEFEEDIEFIVEETRLGEQIIKEILEETEEDVLDIGSHFGAIQLSATTEDFKCNCSQVQEQIIEKLGILSARIHFVLEKLQTSSISSINKQRYFVTYSCGMIEILRKLLQVVGRLHDLDEKIYLEDQTKPLVCDESIAIHTLSFIWIHAISITGKFHDMTTQMFKGELQQDTTITKLEFFSALFQYTEVYLMDLTLSSWRQFNRLVKYHDLLESRPFLCDCQEKAYFTTMVVPDVDKDSPKNSISHMLRLILNYDGNSSHVSLRRHEIMPHEPCFTTATAAQLAYFAIWHLRCLSNRWPENGTKTGSERVPCRDTLTACSDVIDSVLNLVLEQFVPTSSNSQQVSPPERILLSPHQEERFKLLFVMLNSWIEKNPSEANLPILTKIFVFFDKNWSRLGANYFDVPTFRLEGLTLFQLFAKMLNEVKPMYTADGQATTSLNNRARPSKEELELNEAWNSLLDKAKPSSSKAKVQNLGKVKP